ncbi:MAG: hypothetical protein FVQ83_05045 [Chloroflexi bacterium]|nr:hypothetical protein [Chloroflexota bacterium]
MITVFGATGYTGRLIIEELSRFKLSSDRLRMAGRSEEKLAALSSSFPRHIPYVVADADDPSSLELLFEGTQVVINCVGPFTDMGEPVLARAALRGVHYLDITNELGYVYRVQSYNELAEKNNAAIIPACGLEVTLADCAASLLARDTDSRIHQVDIKYTLGGTVTSRGTRRSAIRSLGTSWLNFREGRLKSSLPCRETLKELHNNHSKSFISFPSSEIITIPSHLQVDNVTAWLAIPSHARLWAPLLLPLLAIIAQGPVSKLMLFASSTLFPSSPFGGKINPVFRIKIDAKTNNNAHSIAIKGRGVYETTAKIVAYAAHQMTQPNYNKSGVLAPSIALEPNALLNYGEKHWGLQISRSQGN